MLSWSNEIARSAGSSRFARAEETDRLRVMISKSANFTLSVTVLPRVAGTRLIREYQGVEHFVTVRRDDFEY